MRKVVWDLKSQFEEYKKQDVFDCQVAEFLLSEGRYGSDLENTLARYKVTGLDELMIKQQEKLASLPKLQTLFAEIELPLVPVLWQMEKNGIRLDTTRLEQVGKEINETVLSLETAIKSEVGYEINLNSPAQVGIFLAEKAGVPLTKTKTGQYATGELELLKHKQQFPIIGQLLSYRGLAKLKSTYIDTLIDKVDTEGRIHTTYNQVLVSTGRLSSANPNLQNIPVTSEFGRKIKSCFVASDGHTLLSFDYSQQELRILAHLSGEEKLIAAFKENRDVHKTTASQLFSVSYDAVTKEQRSVAKTINFGIIYGMSSYGMSEGLQIPVEEAAKFIDEFYKTFPKIKKYYDTYLKQGLIDDVVETLLGRRRFVRVYPQQKFLDNATKRVLMNYPIQGTAADLMKKAMVSIEKEVLAKNNTVKLLLQIHDDLVFEIPEDTKMIKDVSNQIHEIMCHVYPLVVPIEVDVKIGKNWGGLMPI